MISLSPLSLPLKTISPSRLVATLLFNISSSCLQAQESEESTYDRIWDKVVLYENEENSLISKFWLTGRLQGEYHSFVNDISGVDHDDYDWRRFRFGFKATLLGDITLHSEADLGLVYYEIRINASCHLK